jgi:hypothetical protein
MLDANRARANLFRYSASASRVSTKSNRFGASSRKKRIALTARNLFQQKTATASLPRRSMTTTWFDVQRR